jgi:protein O-mannosyl-transferase
MRVQCPHCGVAGNLPDAKVPSDGSKITCPKCKVVFFVRKPDDPPSARITSAPDPSAAARYLQEGMNLFKQRQIDAAIAQFKLAIKANPHEADAYRYLGAAYGQKNLWADAGQMLQSALRYRPEDLQILKNLGVAYLKQELFAQAEHAFRQASQFAPQDDKVASYLALIAQKTGSAPKAEAPRSASSPPEPPPATSPQDSSPSRHAKPRQELLDKGVEYLDNAQINNAIEAFQEVIRLDPAKPEGYIGLAMVHEKRKEWAKALEMYEKVLEINPNDTSAKEGVKFIRKQQKKFNWKFWKA